jgi:hypothetical protein
MPQPIPSELFVQNVLALLGETFEKVEGIYLDGGTSLLETMASLSAVEASRPIFESGTTVAAHVTHARFYIGILRDYMDGKRHDKVDWKGSWSCQSVTDSEWDILRNQLAEDYRQLVAHLKGVDDWNNDRRLGGVLAIVTHTAYHLGAIRQIAKAVKKQRKSCSRGFRGKPRTRLLTKGLDRRVN